MMTFHAFVNIGCTLVLLLFSVVESIGADKPSRELGFILQPQRQFLQLPQGLGLAACSAVSVNSKGDVFLFHRGPRPILCFNSEGKFQRAWGDDLITTAHGLRIDRDDNVWVTDVGTN